MYLPVFYSLDDHHCPHMSADADLNSVLGCLHMVSIGTKEKLLEVWTEVNSGSLVFRYCA